jgi:hypothetical protein
MCGWLAAAYSSARFGKGAEPMLDVILLVAGLAFFAVSIAYAFGCDNL